MNGSLPPMTFDDQLKREGAYRYYMMGANNITEERFTLGRYLECQLEPCAYLVELARLLEPLVNKHGRDLVIAHMSRIETFPPFRPQEPADFPGWETPSLAARFYNEAMAKAYGVIGYRFEGWKFTRAVIAPQSDRWEAFVLEAHPVIAHWVGNVARGQFEADPFELERVVSGPLPF